MKNKEEMINWMRENDLYLGDIPQVGDLHGWTFRFGYYEPYAENLTLKSEGLIGSSIYESDLYGEDE